MSSDLSQPDLHTNLADAANNLVRPDGTFSDDTVMSSLNLAMASARDEHDSTRFAGPSRHRTKGIPRLAAIRMEEGGVDGQYDADGGEDDQDSELFNLENPSTPSTKRGRGRPKGSLDRNPRSVRNSKNNVSAGLENEGDPFLGTTGREFDSDDGMDTPLTKRKPGRPRKDRTHPPTTPRATKTLAGLTPSRSAATKAAASAAVMTPERREANRLAAERSRLRKAEKAVILEKMAKGLTEENVALKDKIKTLTTLGLDASLQESESVGGGKDEGTNDDWLRTGHAIEVPEIDPTLDQDMSGGMSHPEAVQSSITASSSIAVPQLGLSASMGDIPNALQQQLQQRLQEQILNLQTLLSDDDTPAIHDQTTVSAGQDTQSLREIATMIRKENARAKEAVRTLRDELLLLEQTNGHARDREGEGEDQWIVDTDEHDKREAALARHADVEAALVDMKRHLGQLMTVSIVEYGRLEPTRG